VVIGPLVGRAARIIGRGHDPNAVPALLDALEYYGRPDNRSEIIELGGLVGALGRLGDERAAPALVQLIRDDVPVRQVVRQGPAVTVTVQTLGDLALLALTHIYKLDPAALGYEGGADLWEGGSFPSPAARARALRLFKDWYAANAEKPAAARQPLPTTQPAEPAGP
jgi:HEAT repeat protein